MYLALALHIHLINRYLVPVTRKVIGADAAMPQRECEMSRPLNDDVLTRNLLFRPVQPLRVGGWGCNIFVPVLGGNGTKIAPTRDIFDQPPGQMR